MPVTVAVVGMGPLGLMALKNFKEDGFEVRGFERRHWVGGLWKQSFDTSLSTTANTVFNSSRFRSAISDFPFPDEVDDFPTAKQMWKYFEDYCDAFDLRPRIHFGADVQTFSRKHGKWAVEYVEDGTTHTEYFDKLAVSPGSFVIPRCPKLRGIETFQGTVLHSIDFPDPATFRGQNVLLVGFHATAQDLVVELAPHAEKVYIAHKNGLVLMSRYTHDGKTYDQAQTLSVLFLQIFLTKWFPRVWDWIFDTAIQSMSKKAYPHQRREWNLSPAPSSTTSPPLIADAIYPFLESGFAEPVAAVKQIKEPNDILLTDGRLLKDIHTIIYATGYESAVPCAPPEYNPYPVPDEAPMLYRNAFPLHGDAAVRESLAFLGQGGIAFPGFVQFELVIFAVSQVWRGKAHLPPLSEMQDWHQGHMAWRRDVIGRSKFDTKLLPVLLRLPDQIEWLDKAGGTGVFAHFSWFGGWFSWRAWRFWCEDRRFYRLCKDGLCSPAVWRLFNMGGRKPWVGAKEQIIRDNELAEKRREERLRAVEKTQQGQKDK
ncbi:hypothetical protein A1O7_05604 [Cladophialophora yegresii CBS 114405]|uniref:Dimethylaniline monooxygenase (N-oxide forming) n=1 Tax=Cladophialophora yegresii CBS 114405 TaxID=1182544 RepID=W9WI53_9EURO|nr:uncharacterized protein A1O7_05604 [Cladophialophora yegresii CBS 114405]EXJ58179.1 hypothetical protein A1O7_05604 [Cladophialophora yegresii CBS 114405]